VRAGDANVRASTEVAAYQDSVAVTVFTPTVAAAVEHPTAGWAANGRYLVDVVTAASSDIVSTASPRWNEVRHAGNLGFRYKPDTFGVGLNASTSSTPDYFSASAGAQLLKDLDDKHWSLALGYAYGNDTIGRTGTSFDTFSRTLASHAFVGSVTRPLSPSAQLTISGDFIAERGDQSKPYRYIPMFSAANAALVPAGADTATVARLRLDARPLEQLPLTRDRFALTARIAWRSDLGTLRLEERVYRDSWALAASTTDARYLFDLGQRALIGPHLRLHAQGAVDFWQRAYTATGAGDLPALRTGDRELGALLTLGTGLLFRLMLGPEGDRNSTAITISADGYWTNFADTLYVKTRFAGISVFGLETTF